MLYFLPLSCQGIELRTMTIADPRAMPTWALLTFNVGSRKVQALKPGPCMWPVQWDSDQVLCVDRNSDLFFLSTCSSTPHTTCLQGREKSQVSGRVVGEGQRPGEREKGTHLTFSPTVGRSAKWSGSQPPPTWSPISGLYQVWRSPLSSGCHQMP